MLTITLESITKNKKMFVFYTSRNRYVNKIEDLTFML